ncbi:DUF349 domain-containing protein [Tessaracoccus rhinocerotis]|uniref:DUF349 domain-containing protein n=1 Tax=Tessaracoccus rhinocerotis TaxID=1689449 RepID=A0A553JY48_9ACTN|nr:DUF349 domain-containing protein [Tessaracoccus rhinocerotis]TRY17372.1 DUF349 domain-containing protein [Tessaracoccus rhinocerotis]
MTETQAPKDFGRVDEDGTVYVTVGDTERSVGQVPDATPEEALGFYTRRYENLAAEVNLLGSRVESQAMSPEDARKAIDTLKANVAEANAVGDLPALTAQLEKLEELLPAQIEARKAARAEQNAATVAAKQAMVDEAEALSTGNDWRGGVDRFRNLLEEWKALPRIDRATDNELWRRFSSARTQYTRRRKAHFSEVNSHRDEAKAIKEAIIAEAEPLADSTDWGPTAGAFRDLMARWKAAGSARRSDDDALWARFRAIQDKFFDARTNAQQAVDGEEAENLAAKTALVEQVEKDLEGVTDVEKAKSVHREFLEKYSELGHVPRKAMRDLDNRVRRIGDKVSELEADEWRRTDPEARQRAEDTVALFQSQVDKLQADLADAEAKGDTRKVKDTAKSLETYQSWLDQAKETLAEFNA